MTATVRTQTQFAETKLSVTQELFNQIEDLIYCKNVDGLQKILASVQSETLDQALLLKNRNGETVFHLAASSDDDSSMLSALVKACPRALQQTVAMQDKACDTVLHKIVRHQSWCQRKESLQELIEIVRLNGLNQALVLQNNSGFNALFLATFLRVPETLSILMNTVDQNSLNQALVQHDKDGRTALQNALLFQRPNVLYELLDKISPFSIAATKAQLMRALSYDKEYKQDINMDLSEEERLALQRQIIMICNLVEKPAEVIGKNPQKFFEFLRTKIRPGKAMYHHQFWIKLLKLEIATINEKRDKNLLYAMLGTVYISSIGKQHKTNPQAVAPNYLQLALETWSKIPSPQELAAPGFCRLIGETLVANKATTLLGISYLFYGINNSDPTQDAYLYEESCALLTALCKTYYPIDTYCSGEEKELPPLVKLNIEYEEIITNVKTYLQKNASWFRGFFDFFGSFFNCGSSYSILCGLVNKLADSFLDDGTKGQLWLESWEQSFMQSREQVWQQQKTSWKKRAAILRTTLSTNNLDRKTQQLLENLLSKIQSIITAQTKIDTDLSVSSSSSGSSLFSGVQEAKFVSTPITMNRALLFASSASATTTAQNSNVSVKIIGNDMG